MMETLTCIRIVLMLSSAITVSKGGSCFYSADDVLQKLYKIGNQVEDIDRRMNEFEARQNTASTATSGTGTPKVAFRAHLSSNLGSVTTGQTISFDQVDLNLGNSYNGSVFTAPFNGTYMFSMVLGNPAGKPGAFFMRKNGVGIEYSIAGHTTGWNIGGVTTVAELFHGDQVWVQGEGYVHGAYATARYHTGFSGMLVNAY